jgi:hypothetical protein
MRRQLTAALVMLALTAGGCADRSVPTATPSASPSPSTPHDILLASVPDGSQGAFAFTLKDAMTDGSGVVDPAGKKISYTARYKDAKLGFTMTLTFVVIDQQSWMKVAFGHTEGLTGLPRLPKKWMRLDTSKVKDDSGAVLTFDDPDPAGAAELFGSTVDVEAAGTGAYRGIIDLTRVTGAELVDKKTAGGLGEKARAVPFRATVDSSGRLTSLSIDLPAAGKQPKRTHSVTYGKYGTAPAVNRPPAGQVVQAPAAAYDLING